MPPQTKEKERKMRGKDITGIDPATHRLAKIEAAKEGISLREWITKLILDAAKKAKEISQ